MKITKDDKINALERIVKAIFGGENIEYRNKLDEYIEVIVECDVDDTIKLLTSLSMDNIDYYINVRERKLNKRDCFTNRKFEGYNEITLMLEPKYWEETHKLKKEIKELKGKK